MVTVSTLKKAQCSLLQTRDAQVVQRGKTLHKNPGPPKSAGVLQMHVSTLWLFHNSTAVHAHNRTLASLVKSRAPVAPWGFLSLGV